MSSGTNPALIYYYFGDKVGLYRQVLGRLGQALAESALKAGAATSQDAADQVRAIVTAQTELLARHPQAVLLLVRELLDHQAAHAQPVIHHLASQVFRPVVDAIEAGKARGDFRPDLNAEFAVISTLSQLVYFAMAKPIVRILLGKTQDYPDADAIRAFGRHAAGFALGGMGVGRQRSP